MAGRAEAAAYFFETVIARIFKAKDFASSDLYAKRGVETLDTCTLGLNMR